jgi:preprotein translocase subunit SecF
MMTIDKIERRLEKIEDRNRKVSADKAWETSATRRLAIAVLTYVVISIFLLAIHKDQPFESALVPVLGYLLSTLALEQVKAEWVRRLFNRK